MGIWASKHSNHHVEGPAFELLHLDPSQNHVGKQLQNKGLMEHVVWFSGEESLLLGAIVRTCKENQTSEVCIREAFGLTFSLVMHLDLYGKTKIELNIHLLGSSCSSMCYCLLRTAMMNYYCWNGPMFPLQAWVSKQED